MKTIPKFMALALTASCSPALPNELNLLVNPDFPAQDQVQGWRDPGYPETNSLSWSADDAASDANSGSAQLYNDQPNLTGASAAASTCFAVSPDAAYSYGGKSKTISGSPAGNISCMSFSESTCTSDVVDLTPYATTADGNG